MLRFIVDDYVTLKPDPKHEWGFFGRCPKTKKPRGTIVNEYEESITLPYLKRKFIGLHGLREFKKYISKMLPKRRIKFQPSRTTVKVAARLNARLRKISARAEADALALLNTYRRRRLKFTDFELEVRIEFFLPESHRLYHPESDNILCTYRERMPSYFLSDKTDFNDTNQFQLFRHCYLFHDLTEHKDVSVDDLIQVAYIWIDYEFLFQRKLRGLR